MSSASTTEKQKTSMHSQELLLRILKGLHAGASRILATQEMILVGSGEDCDIVLADNGVARHHALINVAGSQVSVRALDAPIKIEGQPLSPGDPVELRPLQRLQIGDSAIAYGGEDEPGWIDILPTLAVGAAPPEKGHLHVPSAGIRRLPIVITIAVLSLASLAIFAAVMPSRNKNVDQTAELNAMVQEYHIQDSKVTKLANGNLKLTGIVPNRETRDQIQRRISTAGIHALIELRSGDDIAADVAEVLRAQNLSAKTRYAGNGIVEVTGSFQDMDALRTAAQSRAMRDVSGVEQVMVNNAMPEEAAIPKASAQAAVQQQAVKNGQPEAIAPTRIVAMVKGKSNPHVVALDGTQYALGSEIPGLGKLIGIGEVPQVMAYDGTLQRIKIEPVTAAELAEAADKEVAMQNGGAPANVKVSSGSSSTEAPAPSQKPVANPSKLSESDKSTTNVKDDSVVQTVGQQNSGKNSKNM